MIAFIAGGGEEKKGGMASVLCCGNITIYNDGIGRDRDSVSVNTLYFETESSLKLINVLLVKRFTRRHELSGRHYVN